MPQTPPRFIFSRVPIHCVAFLGSACLLHRLVNPSTRHAHKQNKLLRRWVNNRHIISSQPAIGLFTPPLVLFHVSLFNFRLFGHSFPILAVD